MPGIDLHTHSTASDGTVSPKELVRKAAEIGLEAVALTDHDTLAGLPEALEAGKEFGIEVIPGCELSVESESGAMHIVGLWTRPGSVNLSRIFEFMQQSRERRNLKIESKLKELGVDVSMDEVRSMAGGTIGRPHFARVLMDKGVVSSFNQAFDEYLGARGRAYVSKEKITPEQGIQAICKDQGLAVLAHPFLLNMTVDKLDLLLSRLKRFGLEGIEALYPEHDQKQTEMFLDLAKSHDLLVSGGSDFHGHVKPDTFLGVGRNNLHVPASLLEDMKRYRRHKGLWV